MITVHLPGDLADKFGVPRHLPLAADTVGEMVSVLDERYPGIGHWLTEVDGSFRRHLSVFVAGRRLEDSEDAKRPLDEGADVWVMRAVSGG